MQTWSEPKPEDVELGDRPTPKGASWTGAAGLDVDMASTAKASEVEPNYHRPEDEEEEELVT